MNKKRILIVDDEKIICKGLQKELNQSGYDADYAQSCAEALKKFKAARYDLAFIDFVLPGKDGIQTCKELKTLNPQTKLVFMTGMLDTDPILKEVKFENAGGIIEHLYKPFIQGEILEVAKKLLADS